LASCIYTYCIACCLKSTYVPVEKNTVYVGFIGVPEKSKRGIIAKGGRRKLNTVHNPNVVGCSYIAASSKAASVVGCSISVVLDVNAARRLLGSVALLHEEQ
jgi:hypothetical protein